MAIPRRRRVLLIGLGAILLLALLPLILSILIRQPSQWLMGMVADPPTEFGLPDATIVWNLFCGSLALGIGLGIGILVWLFRHRLDRTWRIPSSTRLSLLIILGLVTLVVYGVNFLLPYPIQLYYSTRNLNSGKVAELDAGMALGTTAATLALFITYYIAYRLCRGQTDQRLWSAILLGAMLFATVNVFVATTTSTDIYDYVARGRITVVHDSNPYVHPPEDFNGDPFMSYPAWKTSTSAYGPMWEVLSGIISYMAGNRLLTSVLLHKDLALLSYLMCVFTIGVTLRRIAPERALAGTALFAWNPLILMEGLANIHNDVLMMALIIAGFWFLAQKDPTRVQPSHDRRWHLLTSGMAILLIWMAVLLKFIPLLLLPPLFLYALSKEKTLGRWIGAGLLLLIPPLLFSIHYYRVFWQWPDVLNTLSRRTDMFRMSVASVLVVFLKTPLGKETAQSVVSWPFLVAFGISYLVVLARVAARLYGASLSALRPKWANPIARFVLGDPEMDARRPWAIVVNACLLIFLLYLLLGNFWFWPWYLVWPIALLALSGNRRLVLPLTLAACAGELSHIAWNFVWYWMGVSWESLYQVERWVVFLLLAPALVAYGAGKLASRPRCGTMLR